jgi:hypothetical protein
MWHSFHSLLSPPVLVAVCLLVINYPQKIFDLTCLFFVADSIGNIAAAATVAASSFDMKITDPQPLLDKLDLGELTKYLRYNPIKDSPAILKKFHLEAEGEPNSRAAGGSIVYCEPYGIDAETDGRFPYNEVEQLDAQAESLTLKNTISQESTSISASDHTSRDIIKGKVMRLGDFIDTDAVSTYPPLSELIHLEHLDFWLLIRNLRSYLMTFSISAKRTRTGARTACNS